MNEEKFSLIKNELIVSNISDLEFRVLCYLVSRSNDGKCFPSLATMEREIKKSQSTIRRALKSLQQQKIIKIEDRKVGTGKQTSNLYTIRKKYLIENKKIKNIKLYDYNWLEGDELNDTM